MKQYIFLILFLLTTLYGFSQRVVRDSIRSGNKAYKEQLYNTSESKYKSAITANPVEKRAVYNLANTYFKQNKWDEAIKTYEQYITLENENIKEKGAAFHNIGNAQLKKKDLQKSMEAYKNALRLNPSDEGARYNLAVVQKILSDQKKDDDKDKDKDKDKKDDKKDQDQNKDQNQDKKDDKKDNQQQPQNQMSSDNIEQILKAMEQDEKATQQRVKEAKANQQRIQNADNKKHNKDW